MSEQQAEPTRGESGSVSAGPAAPNSPDAVSQQAAPETPKAAAEVESPNLAPGQGEASRADASKAEVPKTEIPRVEAIKAETSRADTPEAGTPGKIMIMSSGDRGWNHKGVESEAAAEQAQGGKRRMSAMAAVVALAAVAGAIGGALATTALTHFAGASSAASGNPALEASVARIETDILALKAGAEHASKLGTSQFNRTNDRLDKVEKAQAEPAAKLAKLSEAVDKLRAAAPVAAAPVAAVPVAAAPAAAKEVTGSIAPPSAAAASVPLPAPKPEVARLPTVEGWVLRDVAHGGALIEGRHGVFEVYAGDPVPGLGRVDAIRKQDGRWVVVTSKGLVVAR